MNYGFDHLAFYDRCLQDISVRFYPKGARYMKERVCTYARPRGQSIF